MITLRELRAYKRDHETDPFVQPKHDRKLCGTCALLDSVEEAQAELTLLRAVAEMATAYFAEDGFTEANWVLMRDALDALAAWRRGRNESTGSMLQLRL